MRKVRLRRPSPALIVASIALFMALGGGAYAAASSDTKQDKKIANSAAKTYFKNHIHSASVSRANSANFATSAGSAGSATNATNAVNAQNAGNANSVGGQTLVNVNVNVPESGNQVVFNANGVTVTVNCSSGGNPTIDVNGPADTELNWHGSESGTTFGGLDDNVNNSPDDVTSAHPRGNGTFALSTNVPGHTLTGNLGWDDTPTHGSSFTGCSVFGTLIAT